MNSVKSLDLNVLGIKKALFAGLYLFVESQEAPFSVF
jgi:hypothetical protein